MDDSIDFLDGLVVCAWGFDDGDEDAATSAELSCMLLVGAMLVNAVALVW